MKKYLIVVVILIIGTTQLSAEVEFIDQYGMGGFDYFENGNNYSTLAFTLDYSCELRIRECKIF